MPQTPPFFSIITITKNNSIGLQKTHASIASQTCNDYEWLVQDGASTDDTLQYLENTPAKIQSTPDSGIYNAMNRAITRTTGRYLIFMNAGDTLAAADTLETIITQTKDKNPAFLPAFLYGDAIEDNTHKRARPSAAIARGMFTHHQSMLYNRTSLGDLRYNETYTIAADYDLTARFLKEHNNNDALYIPAPICIFETGGISQQNAKQGRAEQHQIRKTLNLCSPITNAAITIAQRLNLALRKTCPPLYWFLKKL